MLFSHAPSAATPWPAPLSSSSARRQLPQLVPPPRCAREKAHDAVSFPGGDEAATTTLLRHGLRAEPVPRHVAVVMDGNSRWARARGLPVAEGHRAGRRTLERMVRLSRDLGVRALTAFACSHENLSRPKEEVDCLMGIFEGYIRDMAHQFPSEGIRLHVIGDSPRRPASLMNAARDAYEATKNNSDLVLMLAIGYSGRRDMLQACRGIAEDARAGRLGPEDIDDALVTRRLGTGVAGEEVSCPDLVIRTSGELRLSNFLLWQSAYSELFFSDKMWPDFDEEEYGTALASYQSRDRRFGQRKQ
ncbi:hypothetical protein QOZ80_7AG0566370 [Eleusine coracana subsp. coracana]|nr:hypothetical protein QOZ80_7AG0566370 [Eleusine coracana subsp. coracana]